MKSHRISWCCVLSLLGFAWLAPVSFGQITGNGGDGVLNAPYRGTITSLRDASMDVGYGEVMNWVEPAGSTLTFTSNSLSVWCDTSSPGFSGWDRSILRLYREADASGQEIDLTGHTDQNSAIPLTVTIGSFQRLSFRAMNTKTLATQKFKIIFRYNMGTGITNAERTIKVAPITGSFNALPGESEAFNYGTPILDISVGNAKLVVPIGRSAEMIGATFYDRRANFPPAGFTTSDVVFPGAAESVFIPNQNQFRLLYSGPNKSDFGTPWPGYLIGFSESGTIYGSDGTRFFSHSGASATGIRRTEYIALYSGDSTGTFSVPTQRYFFDSSNRVIQIRDGGGLGTNYITLTRNSLTGVVTGISTSDGRSWAIESNSDGNITGVVPNSGKGARYFSWSGPLNAGGRVTQVRLSSMPDTDVLYQFVYDSNGDLREEWRYIESEGRLCKTVDHLVVNDSLRVRKEYFGTGPNDFRQYDFRYDVVNLLSHRLASITSYPQPGGTGPAATTTYTHNVGSPSGSLPVGVGDPPNSAGTMVLTDVTLPDGTIIHHDYDSQFNPQWSSNSQINVGLRTKTMRIGPSGLLVTMDRDYEFFYPPSSGANPYLFYKPRLVHERDGRGIISQVEYDYENGGADQNNDGYNGEVMNQLISKTGPTITLGTSGTRTPVTRYYYNNNDINSDITKRGTLRRQETDYGSGQFRATEFTYDSLLRLTSQIVDPGGQNITTSYQYVDGAPTQDRITIDPNNYYTRTQFDNDGRVQTIERFLNPGAASGPPVYTTVNVYDAAGRLQSQTVDNKDQDGNSLSPATITTTFSYDRLGRLLKRTVDPSGIGQQSNFAYNWLGDVVREFDTSGRGVARTYEGRGLVAMETPLAFGQTPDTNLTTAFTYNALGFLVNVISPTGTQTQRIYDDFGRVHQEIRYPHSNSFGEQNVATTYEYDAANNVTRTYVQENNVALSDATAFFDEGGFKYESRQRLTFGSNSTNDPVTQYQYDWAGNLLTTTSSGDSTVGNRVVTTAYDGANRVAGVTDSEGGQTTFVRDQRGNVTQQAVRIDSSNSAITDMLYDALSRVIKITDPADKIGNRHYSERKYDSRGNLLRETKRDSANNPVLTTLFGYDNAGRNVRQAVMANPATLTASSINPASDRVLDFGYDADGRLTTSTTYNSNHNTPLTTVTTYDSLGRVYTVTDPSSSFTADNYFTNGLLYQRTVFDGLSNQVFAFTYDGHDRLRTQTSLGSPNLTTTIQYDGLGQQIRTTDPKGITARTDYDLVGRQIRLTEDEGGSTERITQFAYNSLGQLVAQTALNKNSTGAPLANQVTTFRYDTLGRKRRAIYPDSTNTNPPETCTDCVKAEYDDAGRMVTRTDQRNLTSTYSYDRRGLMLTRTTGTALDTWDYDAVGRPVLANRGTTSNPTATSNSVFAYTGLGDLYSETQKLAGGTARTIGTSSDQAGNRMSLTYPGGTALAYASTAINQVSAVALNSSPFLNYSYNGRRLDKRRTTTNATAHATTYEVGWSYDGHRRINGINNSLEVNAVPQTVADYTFTHDANSNPLTQTATGASPFAGDNRSFVMDSLNRLTSTVYAQATESSIFDLVGNREKFTDRTGTTTAYTLANAANEYATIGGHGVQYDAAGNLTVDEVGRTYQYDERNLLVGILASDKTTQLASYSYDALGRRVMSVINGVTTRYYYDGPNVIEERNGSDARVRYHVNGSQFMDERVASFEDGSGAFTYYLMKENFSVVGMGNADGSTIKRLNYSSTGSFTGGGIGGGGVDVDYNNDGYVDASDVAAFMACMSGPGIPQNNPACAGMKLDGNDTVDMDDFAIIQRCYSPSPIKALSECTGQSGGSLATGTFAMHGRPIDVINDPVSNQPLVLQDFRARTYLPQYGRWLQRDGLGNVDGPNLYEAFKGNSLANLDPRGLWTGLWMPEWNNGEEISYKQTGFWRRDIEFSVGKYYYLTNRYGESEKVILYKSSDIERDGSKYIYVMPYEAVNQWARKVDMSESDYDNFVRLYHSFTIDPATGKKVERSVGYDLFSRPLGRMALADQERVNQFFNQLDLVGLPFARGSMTAITGDDLITGQTTSRLMAIPQIGADAIQYLPVYYSAFYLSTPTAVTRIEAANAGNSVTRLAADKIAEGHAFEKHVIQGKEFPGITTRLQFSRHIESVIINADDMKLLSNGRIAYWDSRSGTVVIRNLSAIDGGTAFKPIQGKTYFNNLR